MGRRGRLALAVLAALGAAAVLVAVVLLTTSPPDDPKAAVSGTVRRSDGTPCAEALVIVTPLRERSASLLEFLGDLPADLSQSPLWMAGIEALAGAGEGRETVADAHGWFRIAGLDPGAYRVEAYPRDGARSKLVLVRPEEGETVRADLSPGESRTLRGRVTVGRTGEPVVGARVRVHRAPDLEATTGADGRYEIGGIGPWSAVLVEAGGYPPHPIGRREPDGEDLRAEVGLWPGGSIRGRVVDRRGAPVPGARVTAGPGFRGLPWSPETRSGPDGGFRFDDLPPGVAFRVTARMSDGREGSSTELVLFLAPGATQVQLSHGAVTPAPPGSEVADVVVTLRPNGALRVVVETEAGVPVAGATVEGLVDYFAGRREAETDENGTLLEPSLPVGRYDLRVREEGYLPGAGSAVVRAEETVEARLVLRRGASIEGRVLDADGEPSSWAYVAAWPADDLPVGDLHACGGEVDDGAFSIRGCEPGRRYVVVAHALEGGGLSTMSVPVVVAAGARDVGLRLTSGTIRARVLGDEAREVDEVTIRGRGPYAKAIEWAISALPDPEADEAGRLVWGCVPPGDYLIHGDRELSLRSTRITVEPGETTDVEVQPTDRPLERARVRWSDGEPAAGLRFGLRFDRDLGWRDLVLRTTADDGTVELPRPPAGEHLVALHGITLETADVGRFASLHVPAEGPIPDVDAGPRRPGALVVRVVDETGRGIPAALVTLRDPGGATVPTGAGLSVEEIRFDREALRQGMGRAPHRYMMSDIHGSPAGSFTDSMGGLLRGSLAPGRYTVEIEAEGFAPASFGFEVRAGERARRTVELERR